MSNVFYAIYALALTVWHSPALVLIVCLAIGVFIGRRSRRSSQRRR